MSKSEKIFQKKTIKHFTYHCEASRKVVVITWVHQACESRVVVPCHCIHHNSKVVGGSVMIGIIPEHETFFSERILVFFIFNRCAIYLPKSIITLCKTVKSYNSSNWCCDVLGPFNYHCICTDDRWTLFYWPGCKQEELSFVTPGYYFYIST